MARLRFGIAAVLSLLLAAGAAPAEEQQAAPTSGLYDRPVLAIDPGMHTAIITRASADEAGNWAVTGSQDKTIRVWSLANGALLRTIRLPAGPGDVGKVYAVAMSPDAALIAAGGWTRATEADPQEQIYVFDIASVALLRRIDGLPGNVIHLAFSPDGRRLAATLSSGGLRVYAREQGWAEIARDAEYRGLSGGATLAPDGRLATTSDDGMVRLYAGDLRGNIRPAVSIAAPGGRQPYGIAFSPGDGAHLAIGYLDVTLMTLLDGRTLTILPSPDVSGIAGGNLASVAWSSDGRILFAGGRFHPTHNTPVLAWRDAGAGERRELEAGQNTVISLVPLPEGDLLVASADPWLARLRPDGSTWWVHGPPKVDFRDQLRTLSVSTDGARVDFGFLYGGKVPARFDLATRTLTLGPAVGDGTAIPRRGGLPIDRWEDDTAPTFDGRQLRLQPYEKSRSLAIHPSGDRFVLGTEWSLRAFDAHGTPLWTRPVPGPVWAVNITGDGRLVVAAYGDGTIRWHRMTDGVELLAFMPLPDRTNWVAWTPEGFYAATAGAQGILRWHVNRGWDAPADSVPVEDIPGSYRPAMLPLVLQEMETPRALGLAVLAEHNHEVMVRTNSHLPPGAQLHLLTIGISAYNEQYANNLRLNYADRDAHDLASALVNTQGSLYADVKVQVLQNGDANRSGIIQALETIKNEMANRGDNDLAVVHFSGHGAMFDGRFYLLPADVDARTPASIKATALSIDEFNNELHDLAQHGRVLVLLDACHSGATLAMDSTKLRAELAQANVTVLTSSSGRQVSLEDAKWQHGAFTMALLDAFNDPAADINRNGLISTTGLAHYLTTRVRTLTEGAQTPDDMEVSFEGTLFAVAK